MNKLISFAPTGARLLLGLIFAIFGLNGFLHFIPIPPPEGAAADFMGGLAATGYFFPLLAGTQVAVGLALLTNRFTALALIVLAPITVQIVAFHTVAPEGMPLALVVLVLHLGLAWHQRASFSPLLAAKVQA
ncbi:MAG: putative membrane protein YphA (DoxX/SURF4 family) [Planctomycetota bacterium]|jgi:uncharacterized membrane protein YphA (DoxX/SURF4 family)